MDADNVGSDQAQPKRARIVVGVDGSAPSMDALSWAAAEARRTEAILEVVHTRFYRKVLLDLLPDGAAREEESILERAVARARELEPTIEVVRHIADPPAAKALVDASRGADLLVIGSRGLGGFKELTLGSVSQQCAHHSHCPVVIIRPRSQD